MISPPVGDQANKHCLLEVSQYLRYAHANRHTEGGVSRRMHSSHAASHLDVSGVLLHVFETCLTTCVQHVSPHMRPEACGLTYSRSGGAILLVEGFRAFSRLVTLPEVRGNRPEARGDSVRVQNGPFQPIRDVFPRDCVSNVMPIAGAKPAHARHVLGWTSVSSPSYSAGSRKPLICWIGKTQRDGIMAYG
ncbi:hypothetical protein YC2023_049003 [Brassica napus]